MNSTKLTLSLEYLMEAEAIEKKEEISVKQRILKMACSGLVLAAGLIGCVPSGGSSSQGSNISGVLSSASTASTDNESSVVTAPSSSSPDASSAGPKAPSTAAASTASHDDNEAVVLQPACIFSNSMVIQRDKPIPVWGQGTKNKTVKVTLLQNNTVVETKTTTVKSDGTFYTELSKRSGSFAAYTLVLESGKEKITYSDVVIGEVYLAAGQSNMVFSILYSYGRNKLLSEAKNPYLRFCRVFQTNEANEAVRAKTPQFDATVIWGKGNSADDLDPVSAVAYNFILNLYQKTGKKWPIAFIDISRGGISLETYLSKSQIDSLPQLKKIIAKEGRGLGNWGNHGVSNFNEITGLYNERICPIKNTKVKGIIWYQGESNLGTQEKCDAYIPAFEELCRGFNQYFGNNGEKLPVIYVMLAPYNYALWGSGITLGLPLFWEAQHQIALNNSDTMREIPIYDLPLDYIPTEAPDKDMIGAVFDSIHPIHKAEVGERMAEAAMELIYSTGSPYIPPYPVSYKIEANRIVIEFSSVNKLKSLDGKELRGFSICGKDRKFVSAKAEIIGDRKVAVYSEKIPSPVAVTYAFYDLNHGSNLCDGKGIMAVPFRSDRVKSQYNLTEIK